MSYAFPKHHMRFRHVWHIQLIEELVHDRFGDTGRTTPVSAQNYCQWRIEIDNAHARPIGDKKIHQLPAERASHVGRIPDKRLLLTHIDAGAFFCCLNDRALVSFWGNLHYFAYLIKRDNRPLAEVPCDPGILPNTRQTSHEHHFKSGIIICSVIAMCMLAAEVNEAAVR